MQMQQQRAPLLMRQVRTCCRLGSMYLQAAAGTGSQQVLSSALH